LSGSFNQQQLRFFFMRRIGLIVINQNIYDYLNNCLLSIKYNAFYNIFSFGAAFCGIQYVSYFFYFISNSVSKFKKKMDTDLKI